MLTYMLLTQTLWPGAIFSLFFPPMLGQCALLGLLGAPLLWECWFSLFETQSSLWCLQLQLVGRFLEVVVCFGGHTWSCWHYHCGRLQSTHLSPGVREQRPGPCSPDELGAALRCRVWALESKHRYLHPGPGIYEPRCLGQETWSWFFWVTVSTSVKRE